MGLLDMLNKGGGLFDPIGQTRGLGGYDLQKMMADQEPGAPPQFAPPQERGQGRGGVFGSGYNGEDIMSMLLRAAAIAQGDLGAGAQFGANIGAKARAEAEAAAAERQWRERKQWEWDNSPKDSDIPPMVRDVEAWQRLTPEQKTAATEMYSVRNPQAQSDKFVINDGQLVRVPGPVPQQADAPVVEDGYAYTPGPGGKANQANWKPVGGGTGNGAGGFRP